MSEIQHPEPYLAEEALKPLTPWPLRAQHRRPAVVVLIVALVVLQLVLAGIVVSQVKKLVDLETRIEQLEKGPAPGPE
jgi:hypothetical protein